MIDNLTRRKQEALEVLTSFSYDRTDHCGYYSYRISGSGLELLKRGTRA
ncbi:MAG: hypothetical protein ACYCU8_00490 [Ferrimicrobium acidiphilum]|jgi:hypothetical protein